MQYPPYCISEPYHRWHEVDVWYCYLRVAAVGRGAERVVRVVRVVRVRRQHQRVAAPYEARQVGGPRRRQLAAETTRPT